ncbi:MAG: hypothetical protein ACLT02_12465 [Prevotella sp.]
MNRMQAFLKRRQINKMRTVRLLDSTHASGIIVYPIAHRLDRRGMRKPQRIKYSYSLPISHQLK